jgi:gliding motility-associated-like protein
LKYTLSATIVILILTLSQACVAQGWNWATGSKSPPGIGDFIDTWATAIDNNGNSFVASWVAGNPVSSYGPYSVANPGGYTQTTIAKLDSSGNFLWAKGVNNTNSFPLKITTDTSGNVYLLGTYDHKILTFDADTLLNPSGAIMYFLAKLSPAGNVLWATNIIPPGLTGLTSDPGVGGLGIDSSGNIFIAGIFNTTSSIGTSVVVCNGGYDIWVAKYSPSGSPMWAESYGGTGDDWAYDLRVTRSGNIYVEGVVSSGSISFGATTLTTPTGSASTYLLKLNNAGRVVWVKQCAVGKFTEGYTGGFATDADEDVYMTGGYAESTLSFGPYTLSCAGSKDVYIAKYDSSGAIQWAKSGNGPGYECGYGICVDPCGFIWVCGADYDTGVATMNFSGHVLKVASSSKDPMFIARFDQGGNFIQGMTLGTGGDDASEIVADNKNNVYIGDDYYIDTFIVGKDTLSQFPDQENTFVASYKYANRNDTSYTGSALTICANIPAALHAPPGYDFYKWNNGAIVPADTVYTSGTYYVQCVKVCNGTIVLYDTFRVAYLFPSDTQYLHSDTTICVSSGITLYAPPGYTSYSWNDSTSGSTRYVTSSGTYRVYCFDSCTTNQAVMDTFHIAYKLPADTAYAKTDTAVCFFDSMLLRAPPGFIYYEWNDGSLNALHVITGPGTYWVYCLPDCSDTTALTDTFHIAYIQPSDTVFRHTDTLICTQDSLTLKTPGGFTFYEWNNLTVLPDLQVFAPGSYWVYCLPACRDSILVDSFYVALRKPSDTAYKSNDTALCQNGSILLHPSAGYYQYAWNDSSSASALVVYHPGTYWVYCIPFCSDTLLVDSFRVADFPANLPFSLGADTFVCSAIELHVRGNGPSYVWQDGSTGSKYTVTQSGVYYCTAKEQKCNFADTVSVTIPDLLQHFRDTTICTELFKEIDISANIPPGATCIWNTGNTNPGLTVTTEGTYWVTIHDSMCTSTDTMSVRTENCAIIVHDVITPNGDGINDEWVIEGIQNYPGNSVEIFDKWGNDVYKKNDYSNDWHGSGYNGSQLPDGTYFYLVKLNTNNITGGKNVFTGALLLKR